MKSSKKLPKKTFAVESIFQKSSGVKGFKFATLLDKALLQGFNFLE